MLIVRRLYIIINSTILNQVRVLGACKRIRVVRMFTYKKIEGSTTMENGASSYHRFLKGDESGLEELVKAYSDNLIFFISRFINDMALSEDLMSDTFLELIVKKPRFAGNSSFKTYLFKIGRNKAFDYLRKQKRTVTVFDSQCRE